jgi:large subunit ribosomal protein L9
MEVILLERVEKLGQMGDVVKVKNGYARNYLLPQKKALRSTESNKLRFDKQRTQLEAQNLEKRKEAEAVGEKLEGQVFIAIRQAGENGQLYGSVATSDIASLVIEGGFNISRKQIKLAHPIKMLGLQSVQIILHPEVTVSIGLNVARSPEEAKIQAKGGDVKGEEDAAEETIDAIEVFESEELAQVAEQELSDADDEEGQAEPKAADKQDDVTPAPESDAADASGDKSD